MHALFFEMRPKPGHLEHYFAHVARLRPILADHHGLAFLDRYAALGDADVLLSHQLWHSEEAIAGWRRDATHRASQSAGRKVHFADYRIRVGARVRHWTGGDADLTAQRPAGDPGQHVVALYGTAPMSGAGVAGFQSMNHPDRFVALLTASGIASAEQLLQHHGRSDGVTEAAIYRISRDYGQFDRAQAPAS